MIINQKFLDRLQENDPALTRLELSPGELVSKEEMKMIVNAGKNSTHLKATSLSECDLDDEKIAIEFATLIWPHFAILFWLHLARVNTITI